MNTSMNNTKADDYIGKKYDTKMSYHSQEFSNNLFGASLRETDLVHDAIPYKVSVNY